MLSRLPRPERSVLKGKLNSNHVMDQGSLNSLSLDFCESSGTLLWIVYQSWSPGKFRISKCPTSWCTKINLRLRSWVYIYSDKPLPKVRLQTSYFPIIFHKHWSVIHLSMYFKTCLYWMQVWFHFEGSTFIILFVGGADWAQKGITVSTEHFLA